MKTIKPLFVIVLAALASSLATPPALADDASCKPVTDAVAKLARTPYHEVSTVDGKPLEKIYTTTTLSIRAGNGKWMTVPITPQETLDALRQSGSSFSNCKVLRTETVDGQRATVYAATQSMAAGSYKSEGEQIWIGANGLTLKTVSDAQVAGKQVHAETHVTYDNVRAPAGAQ
ncbi:MAG TPA: hypothetical protein VJ727_05120 [Rhodanobacteraceae bacterium]|nr:hypothetical protein [Rhodanobacteraceae bacterium]